MISVRNAFETLKEGASFSVPMRDKSNVEVAGYGSANIILDKNGKFIKCMIENGLYVPSLQYSLLSVAMLTEEGTEVSLDTQNASTTRNKI